MEKDKSKNCEINWFFINDFFEDARTFRTTYNINERFSKLKLFQAIIFMNVHNGNLK